MKRRPRPKPLWVVIANDGTPALFSVFVEADRAWAAMTAYANEPEAPYHMRGNRVVRYEPVERGRKR